MAADHPSELSPSQAGLRFLTEIAALIAWAAVGWRLGTATITRWGLVVALPLAAATLWGTFRVPGDRSAGQDGAVAVGGRVRLAIESVVLLGAAIAVAAIGEPVAGTALAGLVVAHAVGSRRRVRWLLSAGPTDPSEHRS